MIKSTTEKRQTHAHPSHLALGSAEQLIASSGKVMRRAIVNNPGMALAISAALGAVLACLVKRR